MQDELRTNIDLTLERDDLSPGEKVFMTKLHIEAHSNGGGYYQASRKSLEGSLGMTRDGITRITRSLEARGLIKVTRGKRENDGGCAPNIYEAI